MALLIDILTVQKTIRRISHEIIEKNASLEDVVLLGILTKGYPLAKMIQENIRKYEGVDVETYPLDISAHRDDDKRQDSTSQIGDVHNKTCVIIDDVLYTGRSVRAAMDTLVDYGRPKKIQLAVLIDRGHRELPIRPDYVGKNIPTSHEEIVLVKLDGENPGVFIDKKGELK